MTSVAQRMAAHQLRTAGSGTVQQLADSNISGLIQSLAVGISQAQLELDISSVRIAQFLAGEAVDYPDPANPGERLETPAQRFPLGRYRSAAGRLTTAYFSLFELGLTPTFYQLVDTTLEIKLSISLHADFKYERHEKTTDTTQKTSIGFFSSTTRTTVHTVSTDVAASFQYSVEGASSVRTRLVPVPPPRQLLEAMATAVSDVNA